MCRPLHGAAHGTNIITGSDPETNMEMERTETYSGIVGDHWSRGQSTECSIPFHGGALSFLSTSQSVVADH
jgi:hypothetical protein